MNQSTRKNRVYSPRIKSTVTALIALVVSMMLFVGCQEPLNEDAGNVGTISVRVADTTDARTISPEGNVNISHYIITVVNEAEGIEQPSDYLTKGSMFSITNVPAGTWYAKVDAYIDRGSGTYVKVASAQSDSKLVKPGESTTFDVVIDTLDEVASGDVTVTLKMPAQLGGQGTTVWYSYTITEMVDSNPFTYKSTLVSTTIGADSLVEIKVDADKIKLMQGSYLFEITVQDKQASPTVTRTGVDVMRLVNGLEATGHIDLSGYASDESFDVTITDKIGNILTPSIKNGQESYELDGTAGENTLTVTLDKPLKSSETIEWYVDGELDENVNTDGAANGSYTLTFAFGNHIVTAIVRDNDTLMAVGSVASFEVNVVTSEIVENVFTFKLNSDKESYSVTGLVLPVGEFEMPESGVLEIPAIYRGKPVTAIDVNAFHQRTDIVGSVVLPDGLTVIRNQAFYNCSSLTSINIPDGVTAIGMQSFYNCSSLTSINIPGSVKLIADRAFLRCTSLATVEISDVSQLTSIGEYAFSDCTALTEINIPDSVTSISAFAFDRCSLLKTVKISDGSQLTSIGRVTFQSCYSLTSIKIPEGVTSIEESTFYGCSSLTSINIPDGVRLIGDYAFSGCSSLTSINIPDSVRSIGQRTFKDCSSLETVEISGASQLKSIEMEAFRECSSLTSINIPDGVTSIKSYTFNKCSALTEITIPDSVTTISDYAFSNCSSLSSINIPDGVRLIGDYAFSGCSALANINIPDSVTSIGNYAFNGCTSLEAVEISGASQLTLIFGYAFRNCSSLTSINIPDGVTEIGVSAFNNCTSLETVEISDASQLKRIEDYAFRNCSSLTSIDIPDGMTTIDAYAFYGCDALLSIEIPDSVTSIGSYAFENCSALTDIYCEAASQPSGWDSGWLYGCSAEVHWGYTNE